MKTIIIGYGSAGKRHHRVLSRIPGISEIHIVTSQRLAEGKTYRKLEEVPLNDYQYFVISSETSKHYEQLKYIVERVKDRVILCEKPLFCKRESLSPGDNRVYVGYQLRYHPLIIKLKSITKNQKVLLSKIECGYYLKYWRPDREVYETYSALREKCGGVVLDLSHEIDYITSLFGKLIDVKCYMGKISDVTVDSEDFLSLIGVTDRGVHISLNLDYLSRIKLRRIIVQTENSTVLVDLVDGKMFYKNQEKEFTESVGSLDSDNLTEKMHLDILKNGEFACSYREATEIMEIIDKIRLSCL